jgi:hypothetical protein
MSLSFSIRHALVTEHKALCALFEELDEHALRGQTCFVSLWVQGGKQLYSISLLLDRMAQSWLRGQIRNPSNHS